MNASAPLLLVVNDDTASLYLLTRFLREGGYRLLEASSGVEALELAAREVPDLVLLDVLLPDLSGYEVARRLRAGPSTSKAGIMYVSASYEVEAVRSVDNTGDAYLTQPVDREQLLTTVGLVLRSRGIVS